MMHDVKQNPDTCISNCYNSKSRQCFSRLIIISVTETPVTVENGSGDKIDPNQNDPEQEDKNKEGEQKEKEDNKYFR